MKCTSCGAENPGGARYCIQCGAEQALPTPIAAVAAAVSGQRGRASVARAANAAQAELPDDRDAEAAPRPNVVVATSMGGPRNTAVRQGRAHTDAALAQPAYARGPSNGHLAAFLIVLAFAIAAVAFGAWKMLGGEFRPDTRIPGTDQSVMSSFPPEATPSRRQPSSAPAPAPTAPAAAPAPPSAAPSPPSEAALASEAARASENKAGEAGAATATAPTQPIEIRSLPAKPAPRPAHRRAAPEKAQPTPQAPAAEAPATPPAPAPQVAAAPTLPAPVVDRWTRMTDELSRCTREDFIARVICDQRVRFRYCNGYWGRVPQCPGNPAPERGQ